MEPIDWEHVWSVLLVFVCWIMLYYWLLVVINPEDYEDEPSKAEPVDNSDIW